MRADQLMIGDWVRMFYPFDMDIDRRPEKIRMLEKGIKVDCEPIPLTAEILVKNGFVEDREIKCYTYEEEKTLKRLIQFFTHFGDFDCHIVSKNFDADMRLSYVHELQHALRLCGLNELADNFKV